jgi:hypothetical protein
MCVLSAPAHVARPASHSISGVMNSDRHTYGDNRNRQHHNRACNFLRHWTYSQQAFTWGQSNMQEKLKRKNDEAHTPLWQSAWKYGVVLPVKGMWRYGVVLPAQGAWSATKWVFRSSWRVTKWASGQAWRGVVWTAKAPFNFLGWLFGTNIPEYLSEREKAAYRRIKRYYRRRNRFIAHSFMYGVGWVVVLAQFFSLLRRGAETGWDMLPAIGSTFAFIGVWTLLMAFHYVRIRMGEAEDAALAQVLEEDAVSIYLPRKRSGLAYHEPYDEPEVYEANPYRHLTDDGEFADEAPYYDEEQVYKNRK